ncbi:MAG: UbiA family prenyltransferase [Desulfobacterales bacterium]|nr:UbiA family prenyltransferase [Desulfobacterales bacterium]
MSGNPVILPKPATVLPGRAFTELAKVHLSLYIALSALAGHVTAQGRIGGNSILLGGWVLFLACGAAVLNNIQDRQWDRDSLRTRHRVLVRKDVPLIHAKWLSAGLVLTGLGGLFFSFTSPLPVILGLAAIISYNGLYTPIKKVSLWAMVPGTLCGMIPPAIGWTAVPGGIAAADTSGLLILMAALAFWQLPHYLLVDLKQRSCDPARPGFTRIWSAGEIQCQVLIWTVLFSLCMVLFLIRGWVSTPWVRVMIFSAAVGLPLVMGGFLIRRNSRFYPGACFGLINLAMLLFLAGTALDRIQF